MELTQTWFSRNTVKCAKELIGCKLYFHQKAYIVTETEAYRGSDDPASHAYKGITNRCEVMFGPPGVLYVYLIYGMHYCLNITTESIDKPGAVLIRGVFDIERQCAINGPGRVTKALGINITANKADLSKTTVWFEKFLSPKISISQRIGIKKGTDLKWRFYSGFSSTEPVH